MVQYYLLSSESRQFSLKQIFKMSDEEAMKLFKEIRWSENKGEPVCPYYENKGKHYILKSRKI